MSANATSIDSFSPEDTQVSNYLLLMIALIILTQQVSYWAELKSGGKIGFTQVGLIVGLITGILIFQIQEELAISDVRYVSKFAFQATFLPFLLLDMIINREYTLEVTIHSLRRVVGLLASTFYAFLVVTSFTLFQNQEFNLLSTLSASLSIAVPDCFNSPLLTCIGIYLYEFFHVSPVNQSPWYARLLGNTFLTPLMGMVYGLLAILCTKYLMTTNSKDGKNVETRSMLLSAVFILLLSYLSAESIPLTSGLLCLVATSLMVKRYSMENSILQMLQYGISAMAYNARVLGYLMIGGSLALELTQGNTLSILLFTLLTSIPLTLLKIKALDLYLFGLMSYSFALQEQTPLQILLPSILLRVTLSTLVLKPYICFIGYTTPSEEAFLHPSLSRLQHSIAYLDSKLTTLTISTLVSDQTNSIPQINNPSHFQKFDDEKSSSKNEEHITVVTQEQHVEVDLNQEVQVKDVQQENIEQDENEEKMIEIELNDEQFQV